MAPKRLVRKKERWPLQVDPKWKQAEVKEIKRIAKQNDVALQKALKKRNGK